MLEKLNKFQQLDGFDVTDHTLAKLSLSKYPLRWAGATPITIDRANNVIAFRFGPEGCEISTLVQTAFTMLEADEKKNSRCLHHLAQALIELKGPE